MMVTIILYLLHDAYDNWNRRAGEEDEHETD